MEVLRSTQSRYLETQEILVTLPVQQLIESSTTPLNPGRSIDSSTRSIALGDFIHELKKISKEGHRDKDDKAAVYYINGNGLHLANNAYLSPNPDTNSIRVAIDEPEISPVDPAKYLPKTKSVGTIIHYSSVESIPFADNLRHLLYADSHFKAATAAFFLTPKDNVYAIFRTRNAPQANSERVQKIIDEMKRVARTYSLETGINNKYANAFVMKEAIESYGLLFFHGNLRSHELKLSSPELHIPMS